MHLAKRNLATPVAVAAALSLPLPAAAQTAAGGEGLEEILVTARKREESLVEIPFSINVQSEELLRRTGVTSIEELAGNVAGFTVQSLGPGQSQVAMRGISAGQIVRDQPGVKEQVGVYLDESVISLSLFTPDLELYDLSRVEVLRGPQGTLFGSGSLSGTVRYITNQPDPARNEANVDLTLGTIDDGEATGAARGMLNIPFGSGALRVAAYYNQFGGFIDAKQPDGRTKEDVNGGSRTGARIAATFNVGDSVAITPRLVYQEVDMDGFNRVDVWNILGNEYNTEVPAVAVGEREQFTQLEEKFEDEFTLLDLTISWDLGDMELTSVTSYTERDLLVLRDATQLTGSITGQPGVLTANGYGPDVYTLDGPLSDETDVSMFTQEVRLASSGEGRLDWLVGAFYSDVQREYGQSLFVDGFEAKTGIPTEGPRAGTDILFFSDIPYDFKQWALFGEVNYALTDAVDLTAGLRWFNFDEERTLNFDGIFAAPTFNEKGETDSDGFTPRVMVQWTLNDDLHLNAQVSKGFRLGGINDPLNAPLCSPEDLDTFGGFDQFDDEELWNYEVGAKSRFADGRVQFNAAVFYADIDNLQATLDAGTCSSRIVYNVPEAHSQGIELELFARPADGWDFGISASWIEAELDSTVTSTDANGVTSVVAGIQEGNRLPTVPEFQMAANATYSWLLTTDWEGFVTGAYQHIGDRYTQIVDQSPGFGTVTLITGVGEPTIDTFTFNPKLPAYDLANLRVGARNDRYEIALFVNNLTDEEARLSLDRERGGRARVGFQTNQPRTWGVQVRADFGL
jgi:iron complex outermembrane receptor protein